MKKNRYELKDALRYDSVEVRNGVGKNIITPPKSQSLWSQYLDKFKDPIIIVLLVVFGLSVLISLYEIIWVGKSVAMLLEPIGVLMALLLATGIAFIFEVKANKEFDVLNKVKDDRPIVVYRIVPLRQKEITDLVYESVNFGAGGDINSEIGAIAKPKGSYEDGVLPRVGTYSTVVGMLARMGILSPSLGKVFGDLIPDTLEGDYPFCAKSDHLPRQYNHKEALHSVANLDSGSHRDEGSQVINRTFKEETIDIPRPFQISRQDVVCGDIVRLESGDEVPADGTIIISNSLRVDESKFTGEMYAHKSWDPAEADHNATYPSNFLLRGSIVIDGNCYYRVDAVGDNTEEGRGVALAREGSDVETPLNKQLDQLGGWISIASFVIAALIVIGRTIIFFTNSNNVDGAFDWLYFAEFMLSSIMIAVTLIIVAVPEGLPMSVTVSLALSMRKMLKVKNLVRKLHACETMGAVRVICTDKTGTLTKNQMTVMETDFYGAGAEKMVYLNVAVNSTAEVTFGVGDATKVIGNPTEGALLKWLKTKKEDYSSYRHAVNIISQKPFSTETKYMETVVSLKDGHTVRLIKGAPEIVLAMCDADSSLKSIVEQRLAEYQGKAMRTLGFAYQDIVYDKQTPVRFIGVVGIVDPVREDVVEAIDTCRNKAGVRVIIVTGDTPGTANEIGRQIDLLAVDEAPQTVTGPKFAAMEHDEALALVQNPNFKIISRARPEDKARLVTLLQEAGEVVAVTGDGTNDAPALSKAQVGLSMGDGTSRAKEASDITILDNSFSSINKAILWGRSLYINIRRFIIFQMTINLCACLIVLLGAFLGLESPLTVTQMLWVNLIMDTFAAMALSSLPADKRVLNDPPRNPNSHIVDRYMMLRIVVTGLVFFVSLTALWQLLHHIEIAGVSELFGSEVFKEGILGFFNSYSPDVHLNSWDLGMFFSIFVMLQFWNLFNAKYYRTDRCFFVDIYDLIFNRERFKEYNSAGFWIIAAVIVIGQVVIVNFAGELFSVERLSFLDWVTIVVMTSPVLFIPDIVRLVMRWAKR